MGKALALMIALVSLSACATQPSFPPQPTTTSVNAAIADMAQLTSSPITIWEVGDYAVRASCDAFLNQKATQSATGNQISAGIGMAGAGLSIVNPLAGVASSLVQSFISAYQQTGALPYSTETASIIDNAMSALEGANALNSPPDAPSAMLLVEQLWRQCTPIGYQELINKSILSASITAGPLPTTSFSSRVAHPIGRFVPPPIKINGL